MNVVPRHALLWGWLRLLLGLAQIWFATAALGLLLSIGVHPVTVIFLAAATIATITSLLYRK